MKHSWTDSFHHARKWSEIAPHAPYRASVPADVNWSVMKLDPDMIAVGTKRGGRTLLAFTREDIRDLFLASYHDEDARPEDDMADKVASIPAQRQDDASEPDLETLIERLREARTEMQRTLDGALELIVGAVKQALNENDHDRARMIYGLVRRAGDTLVKTFCVQALLDAGVEVDGPRQDWDPTIVFEPEWVSALTTCIKADNAYGLARDELQEVIVPEVRKMLDQGELDAVKELEKRLPGGWCRAVVSDMVWVVEHPEPARPTPVPSPVP